ncbi:P-loop containing nucleoside triphosphate hydrolase protein [Aspergillus carlsbadensis]|nr:P-loop containing nucleoside triphosphate hydrolase protein [Aspergillus carlsbadensis]
MRRQSTKAGIHAHIWGSTTQPHTLHSCPLIFVTIEQAVYNTTFRELLYHLHIANQLDHVVFDKCHLAITALSYHQAMALLPQLRELQDIYLGVHHCPPGQAYTQDFVLPGLRRSVAALEPGGRGIIYYVRKRLSEEIAAALAGPVYHLESGTVEEKAQVLQCWRQGNPPFLVATSAFGMGVDHPAVRWVIHVGALNNLVDFAQEIRRLSRDGAGGQALTLLPL